MRRILILALVSLASLAALAAPGEGPVLFREDFDSLDGWRPVTFPNIKEHTEYSVQAQGGESWLRAESRDSASALGHGTLFNVYDYPIVRWRWKISNVYEKGDARVREGDDYPIRIYVAFQFEPGKASLADRLKYGAYKAIFGEYPPHSSLNYIWANRPQEGRVLTNAYTGRAKMIPLRTGASEAGTWQEEEVDVLSDYREAFGQDPPMMAALAVMNDSDNTGEASVSYVDYIEVAASPFSADEPWRKAGGSGKSPQ